MLPTRLPDGSIRVMRSVGNGTDMIGDAPVILKKGDAGYDKEDRWLKSRGK
ncbi:hypothetical protein [Frankia sp. CeD]|uniref:hypothetical protein n=1 Tax=Frankia sp. CeD TaxID=258230 RepID=UPI0004DCEF35|nr:hypothetical protein [Frankia sp. CeD]KEZ35850.1 hypothetical protein CEDDRAFT_02846 [Frankia sp. CeD]